MKHEIRKATSFDFDGGIKRFTMRTKTRAGTFNRVTLAIVQSPLGVLGAWSIGENSNPFAGAASSLAGDVGSFASDVLSSLLGTSSGGGNQGAGSIASFLGTSGFANAPNVPGFQGGNGGGSSFLAGLASGSSNKNSDQRGVQHGGGGDPAADDGEDDNTTPTSSEQPQSSGDDSTQTVVISDINIVDNSTVDDQGVITLGQIDIVDDGSDKDYTNPFGTGDGPEPGDADLEKGTIETLAAGATLIAPEISVPLAIIAWAGAALGGMDIEHGMHENSGGPKQSGENPNPEDDGSGRGHGRGGPKERDELPNPDGNSTGGPHSNSERPAPDGGPGTPKSFSLRGSALVSGKTIEAFAITNRAFGLMYSTNAANTESSIGRASIQVRVREL